MPSIKVQNGNDGFAHIGVTGAGTPEDPFVYQMGISLAPDVTSTTGWNNPSLDSKVPSEKLVKDTIDNQEITQATFNTSDGVLTLTKTNGNITVDLDGRYLPLGGIDADTINITNIELDNFKASSIVTESEGIASNDNDTTIPTSSAVKDYVDNAVIADTNTFVNNATFNTSNRVLTLSLNDSTSLTVTIPGGSLSNLVEDTTPQLGGDLDLNSNDITGTGNISITGNITSDNINSNLNGNVTLTCKTGEALSLGDPVYVSGYDTTASVPIVSIARSGVYALPEGIQKMPCIGLSPSAVSNGATVDIVLTGVITGYNTSSFSVTDTLYVSDFEDSATLANSPPTDSGTSDNSLIQPVGKVITSASSGIILVNINATVTSENLDENEVFMGNAHNQTVKQTLTKAHVGLSNVPNIDFSDASNLSTGTVPDARLSTDVTTQGNTFNGISQLVKTDSTGKLPPIDGSSLTNLPSAGGNFSHTPTSATFDLNTKKTTGSYAFQKASGNKPSGWPSGSDFGIIIVYQYANSNGIQIIFSADRDSSSTHNAGYYRNWENSNFTNWSSLL